jgi:PIN domain nuclease of toxin-antitoxin system
MLGQPRERFVNVYVTDTHPIIWALSNDIQLSSDARVVFQEADAGRALIFIPPIVAVEMIYLSDKGRIAANLVDDLLAKVSMPGRSYQLAEMNASMIEALRHIPRNLIPDMPDRIIAATARAVGCPLLTRDHQITASSIVPIIW